MMQRLDFLLITNLLLSCGLVGSVAAASTSTMLLENCCRREGTRGSNDSTNSITSTLEDRSIVTAIGT